ncbi:MAG: DUF2400 domain-containing protein, partial [Treponema sp.]|nr:DUF2400 domain-containing protein [Treponema sp.]
MDGVDVAELVRLAGKYETAEFLRDDPAQFMHRYSDAPSQEVVAFLAANLAFGRRSQILSHVESVLCEMGGSPVDWILSGAYGHFFSQGKKSFYRMFSHDTMRLFFDVQKKILSSSPSLGDFFRRLWEEERMRPTPIPLCQLIASQFPAECGIVPHTRTSGAKRLNMFLRWMVRDNSPVDLGLWTWFSKRDLLMPLDTHVMQEATKLHLIAPGAGGSVRGATMRVCGELTKKMAEIF